MNIIREVTSMWRYADLFSIEERNACVTLGEGLTPILDAPKLASFIGCGRLIVKDESQNPTGSFKDRSASYTVTKMAQQGAKGIVLQSTGNAAASFAVYAARAGLDCQVIVPSDALDSNVEQIRRSGARLLQLDDWALAQNVCSQLALETGFVDVSAAKTPYRGHAKMSLGYEIVEQCAGAMPDVIVCPTGGGLALLSLSAAFGELLPEHHAPALIASQYAGCAPIVAAHQAGNDSVQPWSKIDTPRGGMRTAAPSLGIAVLSVLKAGGGAYAVTPDEASKLAIQAAQDDGIMLGLECGTAVAAAAAAIVDKTIRPDATVMVINTASLLKLDPQYLIGSGA